MGIRESGVLAATAKTGISWILAVLLGILAVTGCAGSNDKSVPKSDGTVITVTPNNVFMLTGTQQQFSANINGTPTTDVIWRFRFGEKHGEIDSNGLHTAPTTADTYVIVAQSKSDPTQVGTATVTVYPDAIVDITKPYPSVPLMIPFSRMQFTAQVVGSDDKSVEWSILEGDAGGTIDANGLYLAPATAGTYTVVATSKANPGKKSMMQVKVSATVTVRWTIQNVGRFDMRLATAEAPKTSANLVSLINEGFYDGIIFHRYVAGFVVQGGDPLTKTLPLDDVRIGTGGPGYTIPFEPNNLKHLKYWVGMARNQSKDSAGSQFYINLADNPTLDGEYVVFGEVVAGFDVVDLLTKGSKILSAELMP